jgi:hypothetical protein
VLGLRKGAVFKYCSEDGAELRWFHNASDISSSRARLAVHTASKLLDAEHLEFGSTILTKVAEDVDRPVPKHRSDLISTQRNWWFKINIRDPISALPPLPQGPSQMKSRGCG